MNKYIRMGITAFKFFIWGGKSAVLRSEISFYGDPLSARIYTMRALFLYCGPKYPSITCAYSEQHSQYRSVVVVQAD